MSGTRVFKDSASWFVLMALLMFGSYSPSALPVEKRPAADSPAGFPGHVYRKAAAEGAPVYRIDPKRSLMVVDVLPEGAFALFGHSHTVATGQIQGYVLKGETVGEGRTDLYLSVHDLEVDNPEHREASGFDSTLSADEIRETRRNMLTDVLEAERHPWVQLYAEPMAHEGEDQRLTVYLTMHGRTRRMEVPVAFEASPKELKARGTFSLLQSDFGIEPFSALGGGLRVRDKLDLRFRLVAEILGD